MIALESKVQMQKLRSKLNSTFGSRMLDLKDCGRRLYQQCALRWFTLGTTHCVVHSLQYTQWRLPNECRAILMQQHEPFEANYWLVISFQHKLSLLNFDAHHKRHLNRPQIILLLFIRAIQRQFIGNLIEIFGRYDPFNDHKL